MCTCLCTHNIDKATLEDDVHACMCVHRERVQSLLGAYLCVTRRSRVCTRTYTITMPLFVYSGTCMFVFRVTVRL